MTEVSAAGHCEHVRDWCDEGARQRRHRASFVAADTSHAALTDALPSLRPVNQLSILGEGEGDDEGAAASRRTTGSGGRLIDLRALVADSGGTDNEA